MDQDEPEKRVADLKRPHGKPRRSDLQPTHPRGPQPANAEPEAGSGRQKSTVVRTLLTGMSTGILLVAFGIGALAYAKYYSYGYWVGTPTTATVDHCEAGGGLLSSGLKQDWIRRFDDDPDFFCTATWTVGGQPQSGPIRPPFSSSDGDRYERPHSSLNVHVSNGSAYWRSKALFLWILGPILVVWGSVNLWRKLRERARG